jgi:hypothetical protein
MRYDYLRVFKYLRARFLIVAEAHRGAATDRTSGADRDHSIDLTFGCGNIYRLPSFIISLNNPGTNRPLKPERHNWS